LNTDLLIETFNENISYLEKQQPKLFSKLIALDNAVENAYYQEKYELVFDNGYFDVLEKETGKYLYSKNSQEYAKLAKNSIECTLEENLFSGSYVYDISDKELLRYESLAPFTEAVSGIAPILNHIQKSTFSSRKIADIQKFIFFGTGLGLHISSIHEKISSQVYLIVEDDLELFRLSLFTTNYKKISQNSTLVFSIFEDDAEFTQTSNLFLTSHYEYNQYIKYFEMLSHDASKTKQFHLSITNQDHLHFSYNNLLMQNFLPLEYLFEDYQFLSKNISFLNTKLNDKAVLLVAAGPSLQKNIEWLKKNRDDFILVAVSATLSLLEKEELKPDIIIHLDAFATSVQHFDKLKSLEFIKNSICIFSAKTHPLITLRFNKKQIFFFENGTEYKTNSFRPSAPCVGSISYQILLYLKVKNIYLLGLDLAVDSKTGKTHSDSHSYVKELNLIDRIYENDEINYKNHLLDVEGNLSSKVYVTPHFKTSIEAIDYSTLQLKQDFQKIINLSDGANFIQTESLHSEDYKTGDILKIDIKKELKKLFSNEMSIALSSLERKNLNDKIANAERLRAVIKEYEISKVGSLLEYRAKLKQLVLDLSQEYESDLNRVFDIYFRTLLPYIYDYLNRSDIEIVTKDFETIDSLLVEHLLKIC
jgi:hypothetical protein